MGLGQYNSLGEYCGLSTASEVLLILLVHQGGNPGIHRERDEADNSDSPYSENSELTHLP